jgi:hypothetical protein
MKFPLGWLASAIAFGVGVVPAWAAEYRLEGSVAQYRWVEDFEPEDIEELGPVVQLGGYVSGFPSTASPGLTLRGDLRMLVGRVTFETFDQDFNTGSLTPVTTHTSYFGTTQEGSVGLRSAIKRGGYLEPFFGLGYRWWWRDIRGDTGYVEYYQQIYSRLGLRTEHKLDNNARLRMTLSVDPQLWARETIDLSRFSFVDSTSGLPIQGREVTVENGLRPGWTIEVGFGRANVDLTAYWQAVRLGESNSVVCFSSIDQTVQGSCHQPTSFQDIFGLRLGVVF